MQQKDEILCFTLMITCQCENGLTVQTHFTGPGVGPGSGPGPRYGYETHWSPVLVSVPVPV